MRKFITFCIAFFITGTAFSQNNVGIGTSTPEAKLHVSEDSISITTVRIESAATTSGTSLVDFWPDTFQSAFVVGATNGGSNYPANHALLWGNLSMPMAFATDNQMRMVITPNGLVDIGNQGIAPTHAVNIYNGASNDVLRINGIADTYGGKINFGDGNAVYIQEDAENELLFSADSTKVTASNGVLLAGGTTTIDAQNKVDIYGDKIRFSNDAGIRAMAIHQNGATVIGHELGDNNIATQARLTIFDISNPHVLRLRGPAFNSGAKLNFGDGNNNVYLYEDIDDHLEIRAVGRIALTGGGVVINNTNFTTAADLEITGRIAITGLTPPTPGEVLVVQNVNGLAEWEPLQSGGRYRQLYDTITNLTDLTDWASIDVNTATGGAISTPGGICEILMVNTSGIANLKAGGRAWDNTPAGGLQRKANLPAIADGTITMQVPTAGNGFQIRLYRSHDISNVTYILIGYIE